MNFTPARFQSLDEAYIEVLSALLEHGVRSSPRSLPTIEMIGCSFSISDPRRRYISLPSRRWSLAYALGEFSWHTRASNLTNEISWYSSYWNKVSNYSKTIQGSSYGATIFGCEDSSQSQWRKAIGLLRKDRESRRAVLNFSKQNIDTANEKEDTPCTQSLQLIIRNNKLDAIAHMRSNDAIIGLPYDIFLFTMIQEMAALQLDCQLGTYHHLVGSLHIYEQHLDWAKEIIKDTPIETEPLHTMDSIENLKAFHRIEKISRENGLYQNDFDSPEENSWIELAKAVSNWNLRKHGNQEDADKIQINDQVLKKLLQLRTLNTQNTRSYSSFDVASCRSDA